MRTFVAIELDDACRRALAEATDALRQVADGVRWVKAESIHLTLKFIGELAERDVPTAVSALEEAVRGIGPFTMEVGGISGFPPRGTPRVIHAGVRAETGALLGLQKKVEDALANGIGVEKDRRHYVPHLTLGRVKDRRKCPSLDALSAAVEDQDFGRVDVDSIVLMRSDLRPTGAVYTPIQRFSLTDSE